MSIKANPAASPYDNQESPGYDCEPITLTTDYVPTDPDTGDVVICRGLSFGTAGKVKLQTPAGTTRIIPADALAAGVIHPLRYNKIFSGTDTTALNLVAYT